MGRSLWSLVNSGTKRSGSENCKCCICWILQMSESWICWVFSSQIFFPHLTWNVNRKLDKREHSFHLWCMMASRVVFQDHPNQNSSRSFGPESAWVHTVIKGEPCGSPDQTQKDDASLFTAILTSNSPHPYLLYPIETTQMFCFFPVALNDLIFLCQVFCLCSLCLRLIRWLAWMKRRNRTEEAWPLSDGVSPSIREA